MKKLSLWSLAGVLMVVSPAAVSQEKPGEKPGEKAEAGAESPTPPVVKLLEAGAEPRKELRYAPKAGSTSSLTMRMKMSTKAEVGGMPMDMTMPTMVMVMDVTVKEVRPNGDIAYDAVFTRLDVEAGEKDNPMMAEGMKAALSSLNGMAASAVVSSRGETRQADFTLPAGASPMSKQMVDSMKSTINQMSAPFPAEAVGRGAKWDVVSNMKNMGMNLTQTTTMTLREVDGGAFTMDVALKQDAARQEMAMPGMPPGIKVELVSLKSAGTGELKGSTDAMVPHSSKMSMTSDQEMNITQGEGAAPQKMKQGLTMELTMTGGKGAEPAKGPAEPATKK